MRPTAIPTRSLGDRYEFESGEGGTRVTFSIDAGLTGIKKLLVGRMVPKSMDAEVGALAKLK